MLDQILTLVYDSSFATMMRDSLWGYPIAEILHHFGVVILFSTILLVDLRLVGVGVHLPARALSGGFLLRLTWGGFALILLSGLSLFVAYAPDNFESPIIRAKMLLIALAGLNMLFFHFRVYNSIALWDRNITPPTAARISAALSILLWTCTIFAGRLIAYPEIFEKAGG